MNKNDSKNISELPSNICGKYSDDSKISFLNNLTYKFKAEIEAAKLKTNSSLAYKLTKILSTRRFFTDDIFQIFHLGGSHFEVATIQKTGKKTEIIDFKKEKLNGLNTGQELFELIKENLNPETNNLAVNLALPLNLIRRGNLYDGFLESTSKHNYNFSNLNRVLVGRSLEEYFYKNLQRKITVSISNDNFSLAFATKNLVSSKVNVITGIVATGINFGFFENEDTFTNLEAGDFLISKSKKATNVVSGLSILRNFNEYLVNEKFDSPALNLDEANQISSKNSTFHSLLAGLYNKSADVVACEIAGVIRYKRQADSNLKFKIVIEGDLFWITPGYKEDVISNLKLLGFTENDYEFIKIEFGFILGALKAVFEEVVDNKSVNFEEEIKLSLVKYLSWTSQ